MIIIFSISIDYKSKNNLFQIGSFESSKRNRALSSWFACWPHRDFRDGHFPDNAIISIRLSSPANVPLSDKACFQQINSSSSPPSSSSRLRRERKKRKKSSNWSSLSERALAEGPPRLFRAAIGFAARKLKFYGERSGWPLGGEGQRRSGSNSYARLIARLEHS